MNNDNRDFYSEMPAYARNYAMPLEYAESGFVRCGRNSAIHAQAFKRIVPVAGAKAGKVVSVLVGERTDVVAFRDGIPVMTSQGFSETDGIMSRTGCGAIDTSIVFQLLAAGIAPEIISEILATQSGFKAMRGRLAVLAEDVFTYQLVKAVGACAAILEGVEAVVISGEGSGEVRRRIKRLKRELKFSGLKVYVFI